MTLRHLRFFVALYENNGNTTKAADALYVTQPTVSYVLKELESYYGCCFFIRKGRKLFPTDEAASFYRAAKEILLDFSSMESDMLKLQVQRRLHVGCSTSSLIAYKYLPVTAEAFRKTHPDVDVNVCVDYHDRIEDKLMQSALDFAVLGKSISSKTLTFQNFPFREKFALVTSPDSPLTKIRTVEALAKAPLLLRETDCELRIQFDERLSDLGFSIEPFWEGCTDELLLDAARKGLGVALISLGTAEEALRRRELVQIYVDGLSLEGTDQIAFPRSKPLTKEAASFIDLWLTLSNPGKQNASGINGDMNRTEAVRI